MSGKELDFVREAFESNWLSTAGPHLLALETEFGHFTGRKSVALVNGTAAIHLGIKLLGVRPGDEVVSPAFTFVASCNPILYEGALPVFIDSEPDCWNMDPQLLADFLRRRAAQNKLPKAVVVVHLLGQPADLDPILEVCRRYEIGVLEDAAEALGALYKGRMAGCLGDVGAFSFNGNKVITSTGGGMLVASRPEWVDKAKYWSTQACDPGRDYLHSEIGYNYRLSNVLAGIVRGQFEVLELRIQQRRAVFDRYAAAFADVPGLQPQPEAGGNGKDGSRHTRWLSCFLIDEQKFGMSQAELIRHLDAANIESRPVWKPMHTQKLYQGYECIGGQVAEDLNRRGLCLPSSSSLTEEEQDHVIAAIRQAGKM